MVITNICTRMLGCCLCLPNGNPASCPTPLLLFFTNSFYAHVCFRVKSTLQRRNSNRALCPKLYYKLRSFQRLTAHAAGLFASDMPYCWLVLYCVVTQMDVYKSEPWLDNALFTPEVGSPFKTLVARDGKTQLNNKKNPPYLLFDQYKIRVLKDKKQ